jgi:precorrin-2 dehydrogenase/sirohydrochlorin ferrochelatase
MAYFPMFYDFNKKNILVVGGGYIATEKLEKLVEFTKEITVIAKDVSLEANEIIKANCLSLYNRAYRVGDIDSFDIVIVATDDISLQESIYKESRGKDILVNAVDNSEFCDFIFPSFIKRGDLTVAISTSGSSPAFAKRFKWLLEDTIPNDIEEFLTKLKVLRESMPKGKERMEYFDKLVEEYLD